jgi:uncharacterized protein with HEPN domain
MQRDPRAFLWDVRDSADAIAAFLAGRTQDDYLTQRLLRSAVEREFEIIGEALNRLSKVAPEIAVQIPHLSRAVAFRNLLIHGYAAIDNATVWRTAQDDLPHLRSSVVSLLQALGE